jgi:hypothetical protein
MKKFIITVLLIVSFGCSNNYDPYKDTYWHVSCTSSHKEEIATFYKECLTQTNAEGGCASSVLTLFSDYCVFTRVKDMSPVLSFKE